MTFETCDTFPCYFSEAVNIGLSNTKSFRFQFPEKLRILKLSIIRLGRFHSLRYIADFQHNTGKMITDSLVTSENYVSRISTCPCHFVTSITLHFTLHSERGTRQAYRTLPTV